MSSVYIKQSLSVHNFSLGLRIPGERVREGEGRERERREEERERETREGRESIL